jgi:putative oxidoreductase
MGLFRTGSPRQTAIAIALLRVLGGVVFIAHGAQKVFTMGVPAVTGMFTQMHLPMPGLTAPMIAFLELGGGALLVLGLLTRVVAFLLACDMAGAIVFVHLANGFFLPMGYEFALVIGVLMVALVLIGGGPFSIDARLARGAPPGRAS